MRLSEDMKMAKTKLNQLKELQTEVENLTLSPLYTLRKKNSYHPVIGKGNPDAHIMFIGEAPGEQEALRGEPFVGSAGRVLDSLLKSVGLERGNIYITNIVKDRPPENRAPKKEEIELYAPFLQRQIQIIRPEIIVTLGRFAMEFILEEFNMTEQGKSITQLHGKPLQANASYGPITVIPLFHPAVACYRREQKEILKEDFQVLKAQLEMT